VNYLAHAYLSFNHPQILLGNLISDFIKGKKKFDFPVLIQKGIELHRSIDEFTDNHEVTKKAKVFFKPAYRLYSGAFVDIVYDYFLANDPNEFPDAQLASFSKSTYTILKRQEQFFPEKFDKIFYYMQMQDWLYNYQFKESIQKSFRGLVHRAVYMDDSFTAYTIFETSLEELKNCYDEFFPSLKEFTLQKMNQLLRIE
jgi:acyl carrier protein phosphodiesterase